MHIRKLFGVFEMFCSVFLRYFDLCFKGYSYIITANLRHNILISPNGLERLILRHNLLISPNGLERLIASDFSSQNPFRAEDFCSIIIEKHSQKATESPYMSQRCARFQFYVLCYFLTMGIVRAQYSECVPSHSFRSPNPYHSCQVIAK